MKTLTKKRQSNKPSASSHRSNIDSCGCPHPKCPCPDSDIDNCGCGCPKPKQPCPNKGATKKNQHAQKKVKYTQIVAHVDVGYGNTLFIRGNKHKQLSWEHGYAMKPTNNTWIWKGIVSDDFEYKLLINDEHWSYGENFIAKVNEKNIIEPKF